jgi:hypothetical protein
VLPLASAPRVFSLSKNSFHVMTTTRLRIPQGGG